MDSKCNREESQASRTQFVLHLLKKQAPLSVTEERFCNNACVERFLRVNGNNVKKATKQLRNCLTWRRNIGVDSLVVNEFTAELVAGVAYVAGHDFESRPVVIFRLVQDYPKFQSQKLFTRLLVFTLEAAILTMVKDVDQFIILFDSSFLRLGSTSINMVVSTLRIMVDYYPCRLCKAFIIDPPLFFSYLWKGVKPFIELSSSTKIVSSLDYENHCLYKDYDTGTSCQRFKQRCSSSRFAFTVSHHFESVKPWYLSITETKVGKIDSGPELSPFNGRSLSFASPVTRGRFSSTPMPEKTQEVDVSVVCGTRTPMPSFFKSFRRVSERNQGGDSFGQYLKFYRRPYDEISYRLKINPPLGRLISNGPTPIKRRHVPFSQRF